MEASQFHIYHDLRLDHLAEHLACLITLSTSGLVILLYQYRLFHHLKSVNCLFSCLNKLTSGATLSGRVVFFSWARRIRWPRTSIILIQYLVIMILITILLPFHFAFQRLNSGVWTSFQRSAGKTSQQTSYSSQSLFYLFTNHISTN